MCSQWDVSKDVEFWTVINLAVYKTVYLICSVISLSCVPKKCIPFDYVWFKLHLLVAKVPEVVAHN